jgi:hypothetical protein
MRKIVTLSAVAALAFAVTACGKTETVNAADANVTEMNTADAIEGTTNDSMTNVDAAAGASDNMMAANGAGNTTSNVAAAANVTAANTTDNAAAAK